MGLTIDLAYSDKLRESSVFLEYARQLSAYLEAGVMMPGEAVTLSWDLIEDGGRPALNLKVTDRTTGRESIAHFTADEVQSLNWVRPRLQQVVAQLAQPSSDSSGWHPGVSIGSEDLLLEPGLTALAVLIDGFQAGYVPPRLLALALEGCKQPCIHNGERWLAVPGNDGPVPTHTHFEVPADDEEEETEVVGWKRDLSPDDVLAERYGLPLARDIRITIVSPPPAAAGS